MNNILNKTIKIPLSQCDNTSKLNITGIFNTIMDLATEHGDQLGLGMKPLADKGLFWVATKTKLKIHRRPLMLTDVEASTWPEKPNRIRCNRYYALKDNDGMLIEGKTEWVMLEICSGKPSKIDGAYPVDMEHCTDVVCDTPFPKLGTNFDDCEKLGEYTVCSTDIDVSQHMNNVAYIRAVLGCFSCKALEEMNISEIDVAYRVQCFEGEKLTFLIKCDEMYREIGVIKEDGSTACVVRLG